MPYRPKQPCGEPGCTELTDGKRCPAHRRALERAAEQRRPSASKRLYGRAWQAASKAWLRAHPLCQCDECDDGRKQVTPAQVVDHHVPHRGDAALFWDSSNWRSMSKEHHDRKTAREDGGFGRGGAGQILEPFSP